MNNNERKHQERVTQILKQRTKFNKSKPPAQRQSVQARYITPITTTTTSTATLTRSSTPPTTTPIINHMDISTDDNGYSDSDHSFDNALTPLTMSPMTPTTPRPTSLSPPSPLLTPYEDMMWI